ncbi:MAG: hypothetical protein ACTHZ5_15760 [Micrococcaceae bacterium]
MTFSEIATTAAVTAFSLVDPRDLDDETRTYYQAGSAVSSVLALSAGNPTLRNTPALLRWGIKAGAGAVGWWAADGRFDHWDTAVHEWLESKGSQHPRWWIAAGAAATMIGTFALDRAVSRWESRVAWERELEGLEDDDIFEPLHPRIRELLIQLTPPEMIQSDEVYTQIEAATQLAFEPTYDSVLLHVPAELTRIVPFQQTWCTAGIFQRDDVEYEIRVMINDGLLAELIIVAEDGTEVEFSSLQDWPDPEEVTLMIESPTPVL